MPCTLMLVAALAAPGAACAQWRAGGSIALTSDYIYRGVSQSRNDAAWQVDLHLLPTEGWIIGLWASQVELLPSSHTAELNYYTQWRWPAGTQFSASLGAVYYSYPGDPRPVPYDYVELTGELTWRDRITLSASWAPDVTLFSFSYGLASDQETRSLELSAARRLPWRIDMHAGVGYFEAVGLRDSNYRYGSAGLSRRFGRWRAELSYYAVQGARYRSYAPGPAGGPLAATISWHF